MALEPDYETASLALPARILYSADGHIRPIAAIKADILRLALARNAGHKLAAAREIGISRSSIYRLLQDACADSGQT